MDMETIITKISELAAEYAPKLLLIILTWIVGSFVIKHLLKLITKGMIKSKVEISLQKFLLSFAGIMFKVLLFISIISMVGVKMTSFVAILGALAFAVGMSLQGSLGNFAGGVLIILFKPFKVGDYITAQGHSGTVHEIQMFCTILNTPDNRTIIVPNGGLSNSSVVNYSTEATRRVDWTFGIGYTDDIKKAKDVLNDIISAQSKILKDPAPFVRIGELADSSVNFIVRAWVNSADYWDVHFDMIEAVKLAFDKNNISIPFPQMDVHLDK
ncbi:MAG: mechanosensitive ion channel [Candidatus Cloacimonetes bacterium]|nr:mechanosensitive ion channel [Candidatus Cloacimonadota bacterium]